MFLLKRTESSYGCDATGEGIQVKAGEERREMRDER
jgi:hypothetical protein